MDANVKLGRRLALVLSSMLLASSAPLFAGQAPLADTVVINADVRTADPAHPLAQAFAIRHGRFMLIGSNAEVRAKAGASTRIIDAHGATVTPGFIDGHTHLNKGANLITGVDLSYIPDKATWLKKIAERSAQLPPGEWLVGGGWDHMIAGGQLPTKEDLDAVAPDRPVYLQDIDLHTYWANSKALALAGITARTKVPAGGEIVLDPRTGEPTGILKEGANVLFHNMPGLQRSDTQRREDLVKTVRYANSLGITGIHDMGRRRDLMDYLALADSGRLSVRVWYGQFSFDARDTPQIAADRDMVDRWLAARTATAGPILKLGYIKTAIDGVLSTHTALLAQPYSDQPGWRGEPVRSLADLEATIAAANWAGFPVSIHAVGDAGVHTALDAYEKAASPLPSPLKNRIEHIEVIEAGDVARFRKLGIVASMQPNHVTSTIGRYLTQRIGHARESTAFAWKKMLAAGVPVVFGSDWPTSPFSPLTQIDDAVFRESDYGLVKGRWHPENAVSFDEALTAYTQAGANMTPWGGQIGSIAKGKWADFVILDGTLSRPLDRTIRKRSVRATYIAGKSVFQKKN